MTSILSGMADITSAIVDVVESLVACVIGAPLLLIPVLMGLIVLHSWLSHHTKKKPGISVRLKYLFLTKGN